MAKRIRALLKAFIGLYLRRILIPQIASILFFYRFDQFYVSVFSKLVSKLVLLFCLDNLFSIINLISV